MMVTIFEISDVLSTQEASKGIYKVPISYLIDDWIIPYSTAQLMKARLEAYYGPLDNPMRAALWHNGFDTINRIVYYGEKVKLHLMLLC